MAQIKFERLAEVKALFKGIDETDADRVREREQSMQSVKVEMDGLKQERMQAL